MDGRRIGGVCVLLGFWMFAAAGCGTQVWPSSDAAAGTHGVAIVDLDEVARQLGDDMVVSKDIQEGQASLGQQLRALQASLEEEYRQRAAALDGELASARADAETQDRRRAELKQQYALKLNEARRNAERELGAYRKRLIDRFRAEAIPAAQAAAAERGLGVVLTKNDAVLLTYNRSHDITAAVIARLRAQRIAAANGAANARR